MSNKDSWELLFVDDETETCEEIKEYLDGEIIDTTGRTLHVKTLTDFKEALGILENQHFDLLILDVHVGSVELSLTNGSKEEGIQILESIKMRRFLPVIFYTGLPKSVKDLAIGVPIIQVVEKTEGVERLLVIIKEVFATGLPLVNRAVIDHIEESQRDYMWNFVAKNWNEFSKAPDPTALSYLLARRLSISLSGPGIRQIAETLGDPLGITREKDLAHPMRYYIIPPIDISPLAGDVYRYGKCDKNRYAILLTPSCDLDIDHEKAERVLLVRCTPLTSQAEYRKWKAKLETDPQKMDKGLLNLIKNNRQGTGVQKERFYFLPGALVVPDLLVDFQQLVTLPRRNLNKMDRIASMDSPFGEALLSRFSHYFGRLGTPDLDTQFMIKKLQSL